MTTKKVLNLITAILFFGLLITLSAFNLITAIKNWDDIFVHGSVRNLDDLKKWISDTEAELNDEITMHDEFIDYYSVIQRALNKHEVNNFEVIKDNEGMLYYGTKYDNPLDEVDDIANQIAMLNEKVESLDSHLIVVLPASKILYNVSSVDLNLPLNDPNAKMDKLLMRLQQRGITFLDLRPTLQQSGESLDTLFFKTDHHWTGRAAFYATKDLITLLEDKYGEVLDPDGYYRDLSNYESEIYSNIMLGSNGRDTGRYYSGLDDFELLYLRDYGDVNYTWEDHEENEEISGNMLEALIQKKHIRYGNYYHQDVYGTYISSVRDRDTIINNDLENGIQIAAYRDSYFAPMAVFMAPMCHRIDMFWNQGEENPEDFLECLEEKHYDYVILEVYPYNINTETLTFFTEVTE